MKNSTRHWIWFRAFNLTGSQEIETHALVDKPSEEPRVNRVEKPHAGDGEEDWAEFPRSGHHENGHRAAPVRHTALPVWATAAPVYFIIYFI